MPREDISVHRYKFSDWTPSPIKCIAVDKFSGLVAVGREDGEIEITNPAESWYTQARISGKEGFALKGLAFSPLQSDSGRLFGISLCGFVFEVDFASLTLQNIRDSYGGGVWSLAANSRGPTVALGCEDKTIKLFSYANSSSLEYEKSFPSTGSRVLCVAFNPTLPQVLAGCADGTIRCYDEVTGSSVFRLTGDVKKGMKVSTCIWSLLVLEDKSSTIVSGDSQGKLQFWNGKSGDLLCSLHQHSASVQCIAASEDQNTVFASGVDSRVICVQRIPQKKDNREGSPEDGVVDSGRTLPSSDRWVYTSAHRPHSHDVFALAVASRRPSIVSSTAATTSSASNARHYTLSSSNSNNSVLLSGGLDCKLCLYSATDFAGCRPNWLLPVPCTGLASASLSDREGLVSIKHRTHVDLWSLDMRQGQSQVGALVPAGSLSSSTSTSGGDNACEHSCRIQLKGAVEGGDDSGMLGRDHIHSVTISPTGDFIAITGGSRMGASSSLRIFQVVRDADKAGTIGATQVRRIALDSTVDQATHSGVVACQAVAFSSNGQSLAVVTAAASGSPGSSSNISVLFLDISAVIEDSTATVTLHHTLNHSKIVNKALKKITDTTAAGIDSPLVTSVKSLAFSADDRWLAVASAFNRVFVYEIDRASLHWMMPCFASPVTCVAFHPSSPNSLIATTTSDSTPFLLFDVQKKDLSTWSQENSDIIPNWKSTISVQNYGPIQSIAFDPSCESAFMLIGQGFSMYVDLNLPILTISQTSGVCESGSGGGSGTACQYVHKGQVSVLTSGVNCARDDENVGVNTPSKSRKKRRKGDDKEDVAVLKEEEDEGAGEASSRNFSVIKAYRSSVFAALVGGREMVVVENPWVRILEQLPATLSRKRYGT